MIAQVAAQALADLANESDPIGWTAAQFTEEGAAVAAAIARYEEERRG